MMFTWQFWLSFSSTLATESSTSYSLCCILQFWRHLQRSWGGNTASMVHHRELWQLLNLQLILELLLWKQSGIPAHWPWIRLNNVLLQLHRKSGYFWHFADVLLEFAKYTVYVLFMLKRTVYVHVHVKLNASEIWNESYKPSLIQDLLPVSLKVWKRNKNNKRCGNNILLSFDFLIVTWASWSWCVMSPDWTLGINVTEVEHTSANQMVLWVAICSLKSSSVGGHHLVTTELVSIGGGADTHTKKELLCCSVLQLCVRIHVYVM